jgi:hypothetical protein
MKYLKLINSSEELTDFNDKRDTCSQNHIKPLVGYSVYNNNVLFDAHILTENKDSWEKFNQVYGENVTCYDFMLFSTFPMEYIMKIFPYGDENQYSHHLTFSTKVKPCLGYNISNPDYKELTIRIINDNENLTFDDFIGFGEEHNWGGSACGK